MSVETVSLRTVINFVKKPLTHVVLFVSGTKGKRVVPYVIDLASANGTFLNNKKIEKQKYVQVMEKDVLR